MPRLIPDDWMPSCPMRRLILHWTAGAGFPSAEDVQAYHVIIDRVGHPHRGEHPICDNLSTGDDDYAAHTRRLNTGSIGLALCGMAGATEKPFAPGRYPLTKGQWNNALLGAADLCRRYRLEPKPAQLLMHCEVEPLLGIPQRGRWDISRLVFDRGRYAGMTPGEELRERVGILLRGE